VEVYPFILLLSGGIIIRKKLPLKLGLAALMTVLLSVESLAEYYQIARSYALRSTFYRRQTFEIVNELKQKGLDKEKLFFADYHIGYWLLHQYPLTKSTTHPSNLARPYLFKYFDDARKTSLGELIFLMEEVKPGVIISKHAGLGFFPEDSEEQRYFQSAIKKDFVPLTADAEKGIFIWQRRTISPD
jgi:hypothetical protein